MDDLKEQLSGLRDQLAKVESLRQLLGQAITFPLPKAYFPRHTSQGIIEQPAGG